MGGWNQCRCQQHGHADDKEREKQGAHPVVGMFIVMVIYRTHEIDHKAGVERDVRVQ